MAAESPALLALDLAGTFAFAVNGALTAVRSVHLDIVGVLALGVITATGGGVLRDVLLGALPPATFSDWRYLAVAAGGSLLVFFFSRPLARLAGPIDVLDAAGLSLFAVTGATKALEYGAGPLQAVLLGAVTGVGGGTIRDVLVRRVPSVLTSGLYAIPALVGALLVVLASVVGVLEEARLPIGIAAAVVCFLLRLLGIRYKLGAPKARADAPRDDGAGT